MKHKAAGWTRGLNILRTARVLRISAVQWRCCVESLLFYSNDRNFHTTVFSPCQSFIPYVIRRHFSWVPGLSLWRLWWTKHGGKLFSEYFRLTLCHHLSTSAPYPFYSFAVDSVWPYLIKGVHFIRSLSTTAFTEGLSLWKLQSTGHLKVHIPFAVRVRLPYFIGDVDPLYDKPSMLTDILSGQSVFYCICATFCYCYLYPSYVNSGWNAVVRQDVDSTGIWTVAGMLWLDRTLILQVFE